MKIEPGGRWQWDGVWLDKEDSDPDTCKSILVWADTIDEAVRAAQQSLPEGSVVVQMSRGADVTGDTLEIPDNSPGAKILSGRHIN